ncbi:putative bifunctional diguanylate cyclase/phosphodiesterase [Merismopedia glauca]|uniref:GGDEF domain-containing response regulator n=1 Tax=Merismopedia glauca CCAP 1448/3 TaxID=1296344 RepID=A0A2T1C5D0_9CYAN|nr:EAL domain-containing response regulator [Merismopedia glauca]PSB03469.1 GGDEF domain-containing response regulator [Merismopedia glauca CCAP 1448/3]
MPKILIIDRDRENQDKILLLLASENHEVLIAENAWLGLQIAAQKLPDLIICRVNLPETDGYSILTALQAEETTAQISFILIGEIDNRQAIRQGMDLGADDFLVTPISEAEILASVTTRLRKKQAIQDYYSTAISQAQITLNTLLNYDCITELPNQKLLSDRLYKILNSTTQTYTFISLICIGLDRFSRINSNMGYNFGDVLLKKVAERLQTCLGSGDLISRLSMDRFALGIVSLTEKNDLANLAKLVLGIISQPFLIEGYEIFITASIGMAMYPDDANSINQLIQQADTALYHAKLFGGNNYQFYHPDMKIISCNPSALEADLKQALERQELEVYYHPQIELSTGKIIGSEALVRWHHPQEGSISPATFVPIAEANGSIVQIGEWVLRKACLETKALQERGFADLQVSVNISGYQFNQPDLAQNIQNILIETGFNPQSLELELTESIVIHNLKTATVIFQDLKALGIQVAIDDFGTGYSSLGYLQQLPFDKLKIDRSFVQNIHQHEKTATIAKSIIQMAHNLNLKVVCEGIETLEQEKFILENKCDFMQGYILSGPLAIQDWENFLLERRDK